MNSKLAIGNKAPDFKFKTPWDDEVNFYDAVGNNPAVLIFLRYYGCPVCQMEMAKIKQEIDLARKKGVRVFVVLQSEPEVIASLIKKDDFPFTIICDPQGENFPTLWCGSRWNYQVPSSRRFDCGNQSHLPRLYAW